MPSKSYSPAGLSLENGIFLSSIRHKGYGALATVDEQNNIVSEWITVKELKKRQAKSSSLNIYFKKILFIFILYIFLDFCENNLEPIWFLRIFSLGIFLSLPFAFFFLSIEKRKSPGKYRFHSAEHKLLNAYEALNRLSSLDEIAQYSKFHTNCSTNSAVQFGLSFLLLFICTFISNFLIYGILVICGFLLCYFLSIKGYFNTFQHFVTLPPTDKELKVAIEAMKVWLENEHIAGENKKF